MADRSYLKSSPKVRIFFENPKLEIGNLPVVAYQSASAINEIPLATCAVPLGRETAGLTPSKVHEWIESIGYYDKVYVYLQMSGDMDTSRQWPEDEVLLFEGYCYGKTERKQFGQIQVVLLLIHWLVELTWSSSLSKFIHPATPGNLAFGNLLSAGGPSDSGNLRGAFTSNSVLDALQGSLGPDAATISADVWKGLQGFLKEICKGVPLNPSITTGGAQVLNEPTDNATALSAIERMDYFDDKYILSMSDVESGGVLERAMSAFISNEMSESWAVQTLWDRILASFVPEFSFCIVPQAGRALIRPFSFIYNQPWREVITNEQFGGSPNMENRRAIRGVYLYGAVQASDTGIISNGDPMQIMSGGYFPDCDECKQGTIYFELVPRWMTYLTWPVASPTGNAISPQNSAHSDGAEEEGQDEGTNAEAELEKLSSVAYNYAKTVYARESLRLRTHQFSSKLRFDICPGSTVKVIGSKEASMAQDGAATAYVGTVTRVSIEISADPKSCGTSFNLSWLRTEKENDEQNGRLSVDKHPLYDNAWSGDPLIPEYE